LLKRAPSNDKLGKVALFPNNPIEQRFVEAALGYRSRTLCQDLPRNEHHPQTHQKYIPNIFNVWD
jgi:hypothetical protein